MRASKTVRAAVALVSCGALLAALAGCGTTTSKTGLSSGDAGAACKKSLEPEPPFPIEKPKDREIVNLALMDKLTGWRFVEEHRSINSKDGDKRNAAELTGGIDSVQALYVSPATSNYAWNEFLWVSPEWAERNADKPSWVSRTEPGAFEPPYRFAYFRQLGATVANRVFEGSVTSGASQLAIYCVDRPPSVMFEAGAAEQRRLRFVVDPAGYVAEWVLVSIGPKSAECQEVTLAIAPELTARGKHDDLPKKWLTELRFLRSCRAAYEAAAPAVAKLTGEPEVSTTVTTLGPDTSVVLTSWHKQANTECRSIIDVVSKGETDAAIKSTREKFSELSADAPTAVEKQALDHATEALAVDGTRADLEAMATIGRELERAGLDVCGSMFVSG
jgi:hypothetical protein